MKRGKRLFLIDQEFKAYFRKIIRVVLTNFPGIPVGWEDIYNEFLFKAIEYDEAYDSEKGVARHLYLGIKCRQFTWNKCRSLSTKSYKILTNAVEFNPEINKSPDEPQKYTFNAEELLNKEEFLIYRLLYVEDKSVTSICKEYSFGRRSVMNTLERIKEKVKQAIE